MTRFLGLLLGIVICLTGCLGSGVSNDLLQSSGAAPIDDELQAPGFQKRIIPWDSNSLKSEIRFEPQGENASEGATPGLQLAAQRLKARHEALEDIANRLKSLSAAEPLPGESDRITLVEFARRRERVDKAVTDAMESDWKESLFLDKSGNAMLSVELPLKPIAEAVLLEGGGFADDSPTATQLSASARARAKAVDEAKAELIKKLLPMKGSRKLTVAQWISLNAKHKNDLIAMLDNARVLRSEERSTGGGKKEWFFSIEFDPRPLWDRIQEDQISYAASIAGTPDIP